MQLYIWPMRGFHIFLIVGFLLAEITPTFGQSEQDSIKQFLGGHFDDVETVTASPNNNYFASGAWDNQIVIYSNDSMIEKVHELTGHNAAVSALAFSRDGKKLVSGGKDYKVIIWEENDSTGQFEIIKQISMIHTAGINSVIYGPGMRTVFSAGDDGRIMIYDLTKNTSKIIENKIPVKCIAISNNRRFVFCADESPVVKQYDGRGNVVKQFEGHTDYVNSVKYSLNNKYLVTGGNDKTAKIWDVMTGKVIHTLVGHQWKITSVDISLDSKYVITGSIDGTVKLWSVETGELLRTFTANGEKIRAVAFSADQKRIIGGVHYQFDYAPTYGPVMWESGVARVQPKVPGNANGTSSNQMQNLTPAQRKYLKEKAGTSQTPQPKKAVSKKPDAGGNKKVINKTDEVEVFIEEEND